MDGIKERPFVSITGEKRSKARIKKNAKGY
jgi:hypothetical protein